MARLFQFHEEQHEDRPHSDGHWKLHQRGVPHRASARQEERRHHHGKSSEHSKNKPAFPVHALSLAFLFVTSKTAAIVHPFASDTDLERNCPIVVGCSGPPRYNSLARVIHNGIPIPAAILQHYRVQHGAAGFEVLDRPFVP